ncbi:hypothetical protein FP744_10003509 [Trichoderma asperellum]
MRALVGGELVSMMAQQVKDSGVPAYKSQLFESLRSTFLCAPDGSDGDEGIEVRDGEDMDDLYAQFSSGSLKLPTPSSLTREWSFGEDAYEDGVDEKQVEVEAEAKNDDEWDEMDQDEDLCDALVIEMTS